MFGVKKLLIMCLAFAVTLALSGLAAASGVVDVFPTFAARATPY